MSWLVLLLVGYDEIIIKKRSDAVDFEDNYKPWHKLTYKRTSNTTHTKIIHRNVVMETDVRQT